MKRLIVLIVALLALLALVTIAEEEVYKSGDYSYTIDSNGNAVITRYSGKATELVIPSNLEGYAVGGIGEEAFYGCCLSLTSVTIPDSVTSVGSGAFAYCNKLEMIKVSTDHPTLALIDGVLFEKPTKTLLWYPMTRKNTSYAIPQGISVIGDSAFLGCSLTSVTIPDSVTTIGDDAFYWCPSLTSVTIPDSVTTIGDHAFLWCSSLTSVTIPDSVTTIGNSVFSCCSSLTSVTIPDGVTTIGNKAFYGCSSLTSVTIPDGVTTIGNQAFYGCSSLTSVTIPDSVTSMGMGTFAWCNKLETIKLSPDHPTLALIDGVLFEKPTKTLLWYPMTRENTPYAIPQGISAIGDYAFYDRDSLTSVTIPDSVTTIGDYAFDSCYSLTSVTIPDSVTTIGEEAFSWCSSLTSVTIPDSVTSIGEKAFYDWPKSLILTVGRNSYAKQYAIDNGIQYTYADALDWLN